MRSKSIALSIAIGAAVASVCSSHAAPPAQDAMTPEPVSWYSGEIVHNTVVDDGSDATLASGIGVSFIGAEHAGKDAARWRLGRFRFAYAWESKADVAARFQDFRQWVDVMDSRTPPPHNSLNRVTWTPAQTSPEGFATVPRPADPADAGFLLHILLQEPGWDSYPFPGAFHPAALQGAQVFELADRARRVRAWLLRSRS